MTVWETSKTTVSGYVDYRLFLNKPGGPQIAAEPPGVAVLPGHQPWCMG